MTLLACEWIDNPDNLGGKLKILDQRALPGEVVFVECDTIESIHEAIFEMKVRGAPAIGAAAGFGMVIGAYGYTGETVSELIDVLTKTKAYLDSSRPTAVNLSWATNRILELVKYFANLGYSVKKLQLIVALEAKALCAQDIIINRKIGDFGNSLIAKDKRVNLLHHCNTGSLATAGHGTALGVIYSAHEDGKDVHVWVDETRPRLQGAKLTCFELQAAGVPFHLIPDNAAGLLMYNNQVDMVVFGADRVTANGDVANKVGTMKIAICAHEHGIPVYACVPTPTIDLTLATGREIVIEERHSEEVTHVGSELITIKDCPVYNPAFDITPAKYLTGIITEEGICYPPFEISLPKAKAQAEKRIKESWSNAIDKYSHL